MGVESNAAKLETMKKIENCFIMILGDLMNNNSEVNYKTNGFG